MASADRSRRSPWSSSTAGGSPSRGPATRSRSPRRPVFDRLWNEFPTPSSPPRGATSASPTARWATPRSATSTSAPAPSSSRTWPGSTTRSPTAASSKTRPFAPPATVPAEPARQAPPARPRLRRRRPLGLGAHRGRDRARHPGGCPRRRLPRLHRRPRHPAARRRRLCRGARALALPAPAGSERSPAATTRWTATRAGSGPSSPTTRSSTARAARPGTPVRRSPPPTSATRPTSS